jgi:hypothetical protein
VDALHKHDPALADDTLLLSTVGTSQIDGNPNSY